MPNTIGEVKTYLTQIMDKVYKQGSISAILDASNAMVRPVEGAPGTVLIPDISFDGGLADYDKTTGAVAGAMTLAWSPYQLEQDRGKQFTLDAVDNIESAGVALASFGAEFMRLHVIPEVDAYRFAKYATEATTKVSGTLTSADVEAALKAGFLYLADAEVPIDRMKLFVSNALYGELEDAVQTRRTVTGLYVNNNILSYNEVPIIRVPQNRFHTEVTLTPGSTGGFVPGGNDVNFMFVDTASCVQIKKHETTKLFSPDENQTTDGWLWRYRLFHDAFVPKNKKNGIYVHHKGA